MNVKPVSIPPTPVRRLQTQEYDLCSEDEQKSLVISPPTPPPSLSDDDLQTEIDSLRKALLSSRGSRGTNANIKYLLQGTSGALLNGTNSFIACLNNVAQGTQFTQRDGNAIYNHGLTVRIKFRYIPQDNNTTGAGWIPPGVRLIFWRDAVPDTATPLIANLMEFTGGVPTSSDVVYTSTGATAVNFIGAMTAFRNPLTMDRFHVFYDKVITFGQSDVWSQGGTDGYCIGTHHISEHIDLHKSKSVFATSVGTTNITNCINMAILTDVVNGTSPAYVSYELSTILSFSDAPLT